MPPGSYSLKEFRKICGLGAPTKYVYGIYAGDRCKIGISGNPRSRICEQLTASWFTQPVDLITVAGPYLDARARELFAKRALVSLARDHSRFNEAVSEHFTLPSSVRVAVEEWFAAGCPITGLLSKDLAGSIRVPSPHCSGDPAQSFRVLPDGKAGSA